MQAELRQFRTNVTEASAGASDQAGGGGEANVEGKVAKATSAFDRVVEKATGVPGGQSADRQSAVQLAELEELARKNRIQERLAAVKSEVGK
jgi:phage shock protein A